MTDVGNLAAIFQITWTSLILLRNTSVFFLSLIFCGLIAPLCRFDNLLYRRRPFLASDIYIHIYTYIYIYYV